VKKFAVNMSNNPTARLRKLAQNMNAGSRLADDMRALSLAEETRGDPHAKCNFCTMSAGEQR